MGNAQNYGLKNDQNQVSNPMRSTILKHPPPSGSSARDDRTFLFKSF